MKKQSKPFNKAILFLIGLVFLSCKGTPQAEIYSANGAQSFQLEIADTPTLRTQGLMYRKEMALDKGMLFIWEHDVQHSFWMKNTYISLDIIFINKEGAIVDIAKKTTPKSTRSIYSKKPYRYTLEINAGLSDLYKIKIGDKVVFSNINNRSS